METNTKYGALARFYDEIMRDVDYEAWADYLDEVIQIHAPDALTLMELATGTATIALSLDELDCYQITASDKSAEMITVAKEKVAAQNSDIRCMVVDFLDIQLEEQFDIILIAFDSVNYLRSESKLICLFSEVQKIMHPNSFLIFDFTTPNYSPKIEGLLNESRSTDSGDYQRLSHYDSVSRIHTNSFRIRLKDEHGFSDVIKEDHLQRAWTLNEMESAVKKANLTILARYPDFDIGEADENSDRITMVVQCPQTQS